jgi:excisionase family DNA binding protein
LLPVTAINDKDRPTPDRAPMIDKATAPRLLEVPGLAAHLGVKERHVRRLIAERRIPFIKWGHLIRFDPDDIATWLDQSRRAVN